MTLEMPSKVLAAGATAAESGALARDLADAGVDVLGTSTCRALVHDLTEMKPGGIVLRVAQPDRDLFAALDGTMAQAPCPIIVFTERSEREHTARAIELGVHAWVVGRYAGERVQAVLEVASARWSRETALRRQFDAIERQLDERKWIERAKGVLMEAREIGEEEAYRMLRSAAMQRQARLGDFSRAVIDGAHWAEAVNRAGQLRMLSQRLVRVFAQRVARVGAARAVALQDEAARRVRDTLARLEVLVPETLRDPALTATAAAWNGLREAIEGRASADAVELADARAEALLAAAEVLTRTLEVAGGRRALYVVNLAGRQRMLAQRLAKEAMVALATQRVPQPVALNGTVGEFESALAELERAPLTSDELRNGLAAAREEWFRMLQSLARLDKPAGRIACAAASDALVRIFDRLTELYQRSLDALMG